MFQAVLSLRHPVINARQGERGRVRRPPPRRRALLTLRALRHVDGARYMRTRLSMYLSVAHFPP